MSGVAARSRRPESPLMSSGHAYDMQLWLLPTVCTLYSVHSPIVARRRRRPARIADFTLRGLAPAAMADCCGEEGGRLRRPVELG